MIGRVDWARMFVPETPLVEIFLRGTLIYLAIFVLLRVVLKRQSGTVGMADLLVVVLISDAAQNGMADDYRSVPEGVFLVGTILLWSYVLDWLGYHVPRLERLLSPPPLPLIRDGHLLRRNMRMELITREELLGLLREQGVEDLAQVESAHMESNGRLSVIARETKPHRPPERGAT